MRGTENLPADVLLGVLAFVGRDTKPAFRAAWRTAYELPARAICVRADSVSALYALEQTPPPSVPWARNVEAVTLVVSGPVPGALWHARVNQFVRRLGPLCPAVCDVTATTQSAYDTNLATLLYAIDAARRTWPAASRFRATAGTVLFEVWGSSIFGGSGTAECKDIRTPSCAPIQFAQGHQPVLAAALGCGALTDADLAGHTLGSYELRVAVTPTDGLLPPTPAAWVPFPGQRFVSGHKPVDLCAVPWRGEADWESVHTPDAPPVRDGAVCSQALAALITWLGDHTRPCVRAKFHPAHVHTAPPPLPDGTVEAYYMGGISTKAAPHSAGVMVTTMFTASDNGALDERMLAWLLEQNALPGINGAWCIEPGESRWEGVPVFRSSLVWPVGRDTCLAAPPEEAATDMAVAVIAASNAWVMMHAPVLRSVADACRVAGH